MLKPVEHLGAESIFLQCPFQEAERGKWSEKSLEYRSRGKLCVFPAMAHAQGKLPGLFLNQGRPSLPEAMASGSGFRLGAEFMRQMQQPAAAKSQK